MVYGLLVLIVIFSLVLIKAADITVVSLRRLTGRVGVFGISAIIVAIGTSFPELFVGITSALEKNPNLSLGVVAGSNIANVALIGGLTALIIGRVGVHGEYLKRDVWIALFCAVLPFVLIMDKYLSRIDGAILLLLYLSYASGFFRNRNNEDEDDGQNFVFRFLRKVNHISGEKYKDYARVFVGIALLLFSADAIVRSSKLLAEMVGIPIFIIGLFILAIGTSLPELAFSLRSVEDHEPSMFFGNILGSIIANSTLILGVTSILNPITIVATNRIYIAGFSFVVIFLIFYYFIRSKHRLDRWEAVFLILMYITFAIVEIIY